MIGKIIAGASFAGTVGYVIKKQSRILSADGVTTPNVREMIQDFKDQTLLNPRIKNAVGHISLSFSSKDAPRMTDALMTQITKEYMQKMNITTRSIYWCVISTNRIRTAIWSIIEWGMTGKPFRIRTSKSEMRKSVGH